MLLGAFKKSRRVAWTDPFKRRSGLLARTRNSQPEFKFLREASLREASLRKASLREESMASVGCRRVGCVALRACDLTSRRCRQGGPDVELVL